MADRTQDTHWDQEWLVKIAEIEQAKGHKICGVRTRTDPPAPCALPAGCRTNHPRSGRCWLHGGRAPSGPEHPSWKYGLHSRVTRLDIAEAAEDFLKNPEVFDLREEIAILRALVAHMVNNGATDDAIEAIERLVKSVQRFSDIERGRQMVVNVVDVVAAMDQVVGVIRNHVRDRETLERISNDLRRLHLFPQVTRENEDSPDA